MTLETLASNNPWEDSDDIHTLHASYTPGLSHRTASPSSEPALNGQITFEHELQRDQESSESSDISDLSSSQAGGSQTTASTTSSSAAPRSRNIPSTKTSAEVDALARAAAVELLDAPRPTRHARAHTTDISFESDLHPLSQPPSPHSSPALSRAPSPVDRTHTVMPGDSIAGLALRYRVSAAALRRANGLWTNDSIHLRKILIIPVDENGQDNSGFFPTNGSAAGSGNARGATSATVSRATRHHVRAATATTMGAAAGIPTRMRGPAAAVDLAASFSLTLPRIRLSLDLPSKAPDEQDPEHELLPMQRASFDGISRAGLRRRIKARPALNIPRPAPTTTKQPGPVKGMVVPHID